MAPPIGLTGFAGGQYGAFSGRDDEYADRGEVAEPSEKDNQPNQTDHDTPDDLQRGTERDHRVVDLTHERGELILREPFTVAQERYRKKPCDKISD